jgi:hypothetical protein
MLCAFFALSFFFSLFCCICGGTLRFKVDVSCADALPFRLQTDSDQAAPSALDWWRRWRRGVRFRSFPCFSIPSLTHLQLLLLSIHAPARPTDMDVVRLFPSLPSFFPLTFLLSPFSDSSIRDLSRSFSSHELCTYVVPHPLIATLRYQRKKGTEKRRLYRSFALLLHENRNEKRGTRNEERETYPYRGDKVGQGWGDVRRERKTIKKEKGKRVKGEDADAGSNEGWGSIGYLVVSVSGVRERERERKTRVGEGGVFRRFRSRGDSRRASDHTLCGRTPRIPLVSLQLEIGRTQKRSEGRGARRTFTIIAELLPSVHS